MFERVRDAAGRAFFHPALKAAAHLRRAAGLDDAEREQQMKDRLAVVEIRADEVVDALKPLGGDMQREHICRWK